MGYAKCSGFYFVAGNSRLRLVPSLKKCFGEMKEMFQSREYREDEVTAVSVRLRFCEPARLYCLQLASWLRVAAHWLSEAHQAQRSAEYLLSVWWRTKGTRVAFVALDCTVLAWDRTVNSWSCYVSKNKTNWQPLMSLSLLLNCGDVKEQ